MAGPSSPPARPTESSACRTAPSRPTWHGTCAMTPDTTPSAAWPVRLDRRGEYHMPTVTARPAADLIARFESLAGRDPDRAAVAGEGRTVSYGELNAAAA